jgi:hypothetical protein
MPQRHREPCPPEYRDHIMDLARAGGTPRQRDVEFEASELSRSHSRGRDLSCG